MQASWNATPKSGTAGLPREEALRNRMTGAGDHFLQNDTLGQISLLVWSLPGTAFNLKNLLLRRAEVDVILRLVLEKAGFIEVNQQ